MFLILWTEKDLCLDGTFISFDQDVVNGCMKKFVKTKQPIWKMLAILAADIYDQYDAVFAWVIILDYFTGEIKLKQNNTLFWCKY